MAVSQSTAFSPKIPQPSVISTTLSTPLFQEAASTGHRCRSIKFLTERQRPIVCSAISGSRDNLVGANLLETVKVFDLDGNGIPVSDLWKDRKAVVAFARYFGCVLCRKRADYLAAKKDIMDASGVALVLIGPGSVDQAKTFFEQTKFKGEVYADPNHSSYEALKFVSGVLTTFTPKAGLKIIQSYILRQYSLTWKSIDKTGNFHLKGDCVQSGWQQGGIIVVGPGKTNISYIHKDREAGDDPDIEDILEACCS
uniref:Thioredoxin domain-containing protein n=1 Tax=Manihot esculenta TaxID=3983 RepID=A0A2C9VC47_MANES